MPEYPSCVVYFFGFLLFGFWFGKTDSLGEVIFAINAGGDAHVDSYGIRYEKDPLHDKVGVASDYGKQLSIARVPPEDQILYQTERYHHSSFGYDINIPGEGEYVMILKFSEVYFNGPVQKVFDIAFNKQLIITDFDIFAKVGRAVAHDEYIPFLIQNGRVYVRGQNLEFKKGRIRIDFVKGYKDNPKVNAILVIRGTAADCPKLPPLPQEDVPEDTLDEIPVQEERKSSKNRRPSGPRTPDPYSLDDFSYTMIPIFLAIATFIPVVLCLCKL